MNSSANLSSVRERIQHYLFKQFLPTQQHMFLDHESGGFFESAASNGEPQTGLAKRLLSQCRQIYQFSHAYRVSGESVFLDVARHGFDFLLNYQDAEQGGWYFKTDRMGGVVEDQKDLYGHAFVLFSLAHFHAASGDSRAVGLINDTLDTLRSQAMDDSGLGYHEQSTRSWQALPNRRQQNPHMHLLEACLAIRELKVPVEIDGEVDRLLKLFGKYLFNSNDNRLGEYFQENWQRHPDDLDRFEPGHHFEWVWILDRLGQLFPNKVSGIYTHRLFETAWTEGRNRENGLIWDVVEGNRPGADKTHRLWPQTECIKSLTCELPGMSGEQRREALHLKLEQLFHTHLKEDGTWIEQLGEDGRPVRTNMPATSGYHITMALIEVLSTR